MAVMDVPMVVLKLAPADVVGVRLETVVVRFMLDGD